ncbi:MAG: hypothetical protein DWQ02_10290 [Bacteroidetes bacterium]|nr:MAG: hypothetical protein DWQ02_10290 [Bacteroidota bacterium]
MTDVLLITASNLPIEEPETGKLLETLKGLGLSGKIVAWDDKTINWQDCKLVVIRTPWDYVEKYPEFRRWLELTGTKTKVWNPVKTILWNIHKSYLLELQEQGVPIVPTKLVSAGSEKKLSELLPEDFGNEIVIKPAISISAKGTGRFMKDAPEAEAHFNHLIAARDVLIQPFLPEIQQKGEVSMMYFHGKYSHAIRKIAKKGDFRVQNNFGGTVEVHIPTAEEKEVAEKIFKVLREPPPYARVDLLSTSKGPLLMELELIEPDLFLSYDPGAFMRFAEEIKREVLKG